MHNYKKTEPKMIGKYAYFQIKKLFLRSNDYKNKAE